MLSLKHCDALFKMGCFPESDQKIQHSQPGDRSSEPIRRHGFLQNGKARLVGYKDQQVILAPIPEQSVPRRKYQVEAEKEAKNNEKNDG